MDEHTLEIPVDFINSKSAYQIQTIVTEIVRELQDGYVSSKCKQRSEFFVSASVEKSKSYIFVKDPEFHKYLSSTTFLSAAIDRPKVLKFKKVKLSVADDKHMSNILRCKNLPSSISELDLKRIFRNFASDPDKKQLRFIKGVHVEDTYPFVSVDKNGVAFVVFDPETMDARFALLLNKELTIVSEDGETILEFNHSYRTEKDEKSEMRRRKSAFNKNFSQDLSRDQGENWDRKNRIGCDRRVKHDKKNRHTKRDILRDGPRNESEEGWKRQVRKK